MNIQEQINGLLDTNPNYLLSELKQKNEEELKKIIDNSDFILKMLSTYSKYRKDIINFFMELGCKIENKTVPETKKHGMIRNVFKNEIPLYFELFEYVDKDLILDITKKMDIKYLNKINEKCSLIGYALIKNNIDLSNFYYESGIELIDEIDGKKISNLLLDNNILLNKFFEYKAKKGRDTDEEKFKQNLLFVFKKASCIKSVNGKGYGEASAIHDLKLFLENDFAMFSNKQKQIIIGNLMHSANMSLFKNAIKKISIDNISPFWIYLKNTPRVNYLTYFLENNVQITEYDKISGKFFLVCMSELLNNLAFTYRNVFTYNDKQFKSLSQKLSKIIDFDFFMKKNEYTKEPWIVLAIENNSVFNVFLKVIYLTELKNEQREEYIKKYHEIFFYKTNGNYVIEKMIQKNLYESEAIITNLIKLDLINNEQKIIILKSCLGCDIGTRFLNNLLDTIDLKEIKINEFSEKDMLYFRDKSPKYYTEINAILLDKKMNESGIENIDNFKVKKI